MEAVPPSPTGEGLATGLPQNALLDFFFPGFSVFSGAVSRYLHIDLNLYIPLVLLFGALTFAWRYFSEFFSSLVETHLMSVVDIRADDEIYNYVLGWVANQRFSKTARRFVVNTNLNSRSWYLWRWDEDDEQDEDGEVEDGSSVRRQKKKVLAYTPNFGSHWFLYKGRILVFRRLQNQQQSGWLTKSEREEISISCFGRNPWVLKELLHEAREEYMKRDEAKTLIYRGTTKSGSSEPQWQRCLARTSRPLSTVILNSDVKQKLIDDATDYLNPSTRRWYANRGIPYRRGYLLYGPPGTGKSSLSLALAGFFKMRIYIVSLNSVTANEENLASLFAELPRRCVVLLEDIDTAGLTHTREDGTQANDSATSDTAAHDAAAQSDSRPGPQPANPNATVPAGRLSLSGLLNLLDGVCSQEGRLLVMTTNHLEKLDKALIRPGRVDMIVKFDLADAEMTAAIFRAIYAPLEGDDAPSSSKTDSAAGASTSRALFQLESALKSATNSAAPLLSPEEDKKQQAALAEAARKKAETLALVDAQAERFAARIPAHEFSPAELQGYLLKNKRDPEGAVEGAEQWVVSTRKEKKEKEVKEAQEKREKEEKERKEKEEKDKEEAKKKEKKEKKEATKKAGSSKKKASAAAKKKKASKKSKSDSEAESGSSSSSASSSSDEADSASESEKEKEEKTKKKTLKKKASSKPVANGGVPAPGAAVDAPVQLNGTEKVEEDSSALSESKGAEQPAIVIPPLIKVDTDLTLKGTGLEAQRTPAADSGYGTP